MRFHHNSRVLRYAGFSAVTFGVVGLITETSPVLRAQEQPSLPAPAVVAIDDEEPANEESAGPITFGEVMPGEVPRTFSQNVIEELLPESWTDWGYEVSDLFIELYEDEPSEEDVDRILKRLQVKRNTLGKAIADGKYHKIRSQLIELRAQMDRNTSLIRAIQDSIRSGRLVDPNSLSNEAYNTATNRVTALKNDLARFNTGPMWIDYFKLNEVSRIVSSRNPTDSELEVVNKSQARLTNLGDYTDEQAKFLKRPSVEKLGEALANLTEHVEEPVSAREATLAYLSSLIEAVNDSEFVTSSESASKLRGLLRGAPGSWVAGPLTSLVRRQFFADNVRLSISEALVKSLLTDSRFEREVINECIFGARVVGQQLMSTNIAIDVTPSSSSANLQFSLNGQVSTNTRGITSKATVYTKGNHNFTASKSVSFDGFRFASSPSRIGVHANNQTYNAAARTKLPIIKGIIRKIALRRAQELKPKSDALTRQKITNRVASDFDGEVDSRFASASSRLESNLYSRLRSAGLYPERQHVSSTNTTIDVLARVMNSDELAASPPPSMPLISMGVAGQIHDSYLNNALDRMNFRGRTMTNEEVRTEFEAFAERLLGRDLSLMSRAETIATEDDGDDDAADDESLDEAKFVFDESDPIRVRIAGDRLYLTITAGLETDSETIAPQIIEIPLDFELRGGKITVTRGTISVSPVKPPRNRVRQIAQANVMRNKIRSTLPARRFDASFNVNVQNRVLAMTVQSLDLTDGWATLTIQ